MEMAPELSLRGAKRRGNLAVHSWITGRPRRNRNCLSEIAPQGHFLALRAQGATSAFGLLAMTNLLTLRHRIRAAKPTACKAVSDRLVQSHSTAGGHWCTAALPDVSLRGAKRRGNLAVHSWITGRPRRKRNCLPEIATAPLGPRNDKSGAFTIVTATGTSRSCGAGRGQPGPYKARAFARRSVQIGSAFPRLPRAQSALAMTNLEALCIPRSMIHSTLAHPA